MKNIRRVDYGFFQTVRSKSRQFYRSSKYAHFLSFPAFVHYMAVHGGYYGS